MMTSRQINLLLRISAISLGAIAILSVALAILLPMQINSPQSDRTKKTSATTMPSGPIALPPLESFAAIWANPLRRPLNEPANDPQSPEAIAAQQATAAATGALPSITLVGTIGESLAMLRGLDGTVWALSVGDQFDGATVMAIRPSQVDVRINNRTLTIDKPKEPGAGISIHGPSEDRVEAPADPINQP
jgi:hypothetical protein